MKLHKVILLGAIALLPACASAQDKDKAQSGSPSTGTSGAAAYGGSSAARGSVSLQENQTRRQLFEKLDADQSGSISRAEAQASPPLLVIFIDMDANSDGELSVAEFGRVPLVNPDGSSAP